MMKKFLNNKSFEVLACVLVITQSFLLALLTTFYLNEGYVNKIMAGYPNNSVSITLKNIDKDKN